MAFIDRDAFNRLQRQDGEKDAYEYDQLQNTLGGYSSGFSAPYASTSSGGPLQSQASPPTFPGAGKEDPLASAILGVAEMATKLCIAQPCGVLRRQCQVHQYARQLHLTPVSLVPVIYNITSKEGVLTLWKGSIGSGVLCGLSSVTEIVMSDLFGLPRTYIPGGSTEKFWKHVLLKAASAFMMTPFYISSFIETVRSESGLGGDDIRVMEVIVKGLDRMRFFAFGSRDASRRFSILHLAIPTVTFRTSHYLIQTRLYEQFYRMARRYVNRKPEAERSKFHEFVPRIFAQMTSSVCTDLILFPFETILHRMYIQGTRTLIDNLDTGLSAVSIKVKYDGFFDCFRQTVNREGFWALYSGVGALCLEYLLHTALHHLVRTLFDRGSEALRRAAAASVTPPLSHTNTLAEQMAPLSGPLSRQPYEPPMSGAFAPVAPASPPGLLSPRRMPPASVPMMTSPPYTTATTRSPVREPTSTSSLSFPSFGETTSSYEGTGVNTFGSPPYQPPRSSIFGASAAARPSTPSDPLPPLVLDTNDPFTG